MMISVHTIKSLTNKELFRKLNADVIGAEYDSLGNICNIEM